MMGTCSLSVNCRTCVHWKNGRCSIRITRVVVAVIHSVYQWIPAILQPSVEINIGEQQYMELNIKPILTARDGRGSQDFDIPCAVCYSNHSAVYMVPAKYTCPLGWTRQYYGYLMAEFSDESHHRSQY